MRNKLLPLLLIVSLVIPLLASCTFNKPVQKDLDKQADILFKAFETSNINTLKTVLSPNALNSGDLDVGIDYCFSLLGAKKISIEKLGCPEHDSFDSGNRQKWVSASYIITTNENESYYLDFSFWIINDHDKKTLGINTLKLTANSNDDSTLYFSSEEYNRAGIYNPLWDIKAYY